MWGRLKNPSPQGYTLFNPGPYGTIGGALGGAVGTAATDGQPWGGAIGGLVGTGLGHFVGKLFGSGEYRIGGAPRYNSLFKGSGTVRSELSFGDRAVYVKHREFIGTVYSHATANVFSQETFFVNPGLSATFPWLSNIAQNFQAYQLKGCVFEFKSTCSHDLAGTGVASVGNVCMAPDYNYTTLERPFDNKQEMLGYAGAIDGKPGDSLICGIECAPSISAGSARKYIRLDGVPQDYRDTDVCSITFASQINGSNVPLGDLYVIYDVVFIQPCLPKPMAHSIGCIFESLAANIAGGSTVPTADIGWLAPTQVGNGALIPTRITHKIPDPWAVRIISTPTAPLYPTYVNVARTALRNGQRFMCALRWQSETTFTANLGVPRLATTAGTQFDLDYYDGDESEQPSGSKCELVFFVDITDVDAMRFSGGVTAGVDRFDDDRIDRVSLFTLIKTALPSGISVPTDIAYGLVRIMECCPKQSYLSM